MSFQRRYIALKLALKDSEAIRNKAFGDIFHLTVVDFLGLGN